MKIKNLRYRSPSSSFMLAILLIADGVLMSILFGATYLLSLVTENLFSIGSTIALISLQLFALSVLVLCLGIWSYTVYSKYRKLTKAIMGKPEAVTVTQISEELGCPPSGVLAALGNTLGRRYWSGYSLTDSTLVLVDGEKNSGTILADSDFTFRETTRLSRSCFGLFATVWFLYMINPGFDSWQDYAIAGVLSVLAFLISSAILSKKIIINQHAVKVPEYKPENVKTGVEEADDLLREGLFRLSHLADLDKTIGNEKLAEVIRELLDIAKQIFDYVKKQPEKAKKIRRFVTYYLPTATKLLLSYEELNRQPVKGENIKESMQKIEGIMDGIVSTFRQHLDDLYRDKNIDISADIAVMENMINRDDVFPGKS